MDLDRTLGLIAHRCPELEDDMPEIADRLQGRPVVTLNDEIANRLMDTIERMSERLDGYEAIIAGEQALAQAPTWQ